MREVKDIFGKHTPLQVMQKVPWDKISKAIVIYENPEDETTEIHISEMTWKDRVWLTGQLNHQNYIDRGAE